MAEFKSERDMRALVFGALLCFCLLALQISAALGLGCGQQRRGSQVSVTGAERCATPSKNDRDAPPSPLHQGCALCAAGQSFLVQTRAEPLSRAAFHPLSQDHASSLHSRATMFSSSTGFATSWSSRAPPAPAESA